MRKAKILATLGPASNQQFIIEAMLNAGLNAIRINMSHGTQEQHAETIALARKVASSLGKPLSILVDLSGPKIRTRTLENGESIPQRNVLAKAIHVVRGSQVECPSLVFVRLPSDNVPVYHFVKLVSNIEFHVQSQCFVHSKFQSQRSPDQ